MEQVEVSKLPYYQKQPEDGRTIVLLPFFENGEYKIPIQKDGKIVLLKPESLAIGGYFAIEAQKPNLDINLPISDLLIQRVTSKKLIHLNKSLISDITNFAITIEKYCLISKSGEDRIAAALLIATELEFLFYNVRSLYDLLQKIIKDLWDRTTIANSGLKKKKLPDSFRDVVLKGEDDKVRSVQEMMNAYGLPQPLAKFYEDQAPFFKLCRAVRDDIIHRGKSFYDQPIFGLDRGFAIDTTIYPYKEFNCWDRKTLENGKLGSILAVVAFITKQSIQSTTNYVDTVVSCIKLPESIGSDWHVFIRNPYVKHLHHLDNYINDPWLK